MEELIAKRYATALSSVSKDIASIAEVLNVLTEAIDNNEVKTALTSPIVTAEKKTEMILSALGKKELSKLEKTLKTYTGSEIKLTQEKTDLDGLRVSVDDLGIEVNFSKQRVKEQLIDFIKKSL